MTTYERDVFGETIHLWVAAGGHAMDEENLCMVDEFFNHKPLCDGARVLDLGSGLGRYAPYFKSKGLRYVGIDGSKAVVEAARKFNPEAHFDHVRIQDFAFAA